MQEMPRTSAILLMGGSGARFQSATPKQFHPLGGKPLYLHALETMLASNLFHEIILVCHPDWISQIGGIPRTRVVLGGSTRQESSRRGVLSATADLILIHDAARPFVSERILRDNVVEASFHGAVDTCIPSADTLVHAPNGNWISSIPKRAEFFRGQTPQTFRADWIREAHEAALRDGIQNATDDCSLVLRLGKPVAIVLGEEKNLKITTDFDLALAERFLTLSPN